MKKLKFNWGTAIFGVIVFVVLIFVGIIIFSLHQDVNLVSDDYYAKEVAYEKQIQRIKNTQNLSSPVVFLDSKDTVFICLPQDFKGKKIKASAHLFFYQNHERDIHFDISLDNGLNYSIPIKDLFKGRYALKLTWNDGNSEYYQEQDIKIE
jgi:hypothetical protein